MRLRLRSLHARMLAMSALATVVALALAGWAIAGVLEGFVTAGLDQRLDAEVALLASAVDADGRIDRARLEQRLAALAAGPGWRWRWRIVAPGGTLGSTDFPQLDEWPPGPAAPPREAGPLLPVPSPEHLRPIDGDDAAGVRVHARRLTFATRRGMVELTAAAPREVVGRPIRAALAPLLGALAALAALLAVSTLVQLRIGLRPLRALRDQVAAIRTGGRERIDESQPSELLPLASELNALARDNEAALATARLTAANLAHALKTPVATLALEVRDEPARAAQVARIDATIRHHLARARVEAGSRRARTPLAPAIADLVDTMTRLYAGRRLEFAVDVPAALSVAIDARDVDELLGNLLDNAAKHAVRRIGVSAVLASSDARRIEIRIADDGMGIPVHERSRVVQPGTRLDERPDGHGFGLSIAVELIGFYGGTIDLDEAPHGGLLVRLSLPAAPPAGTRQA